jgi:hypothetical protein
MVEVSSFLLIIVGLSMIGGIIFGLYFTTIVSFIFDLKKRRKNPTTNFTTRREQENVQKLENVLKTKPDLIKKNSELMEDELKIYQFEKDLATHAIEKILLAVKNKAIDSFEQDRLLLKYKDQLKKLNGKMEKIQSEIDVTKLINLRNDLAFLIDNKISDIDEKIKEINLKIGTNYNIKDILLNSTRKNKSYEDDSKKNINNNSFIDTAGTIGEADNLNYRELTTYKNNPTQKRKEMIIESERKKIEDLKDQVLVALDRLDKTGDIKIEINDDLDTKKFTENKTFMDKDPPDKNQKKQEIYEKMEKKKEEEYSSIKNDKKYSNTVIKEDKSNSPTIFSSLKKFHNDNVMTTKGTFDPSLSKNSEEGGLNYGNLNPNTAVNESNSLSERDIEKNNNDNYNKKTPLSNLLNQGSPNLYHSSIKSKYNNKNDLSKDQSPKDRTAASLGLHHPHLNKKDNKNNRFKFPLASIFSKNRKEKEEEEGKHINGEKRNFVTHEERKDPLRNIVNKKK